MTFKDWVRKSIIGPHYVVVIFMMAVWAVFAVRSYVQIKTKAHTYVKQSADMISTASSQHNRVVIESVLETLLSQGGAVAAEVCDGAKQIIGVNANLTGCLSSSTIFENLIEEKIPGSATQVLRARFSVLSDLSSVLSGLGFALILVFCGIYFIQTVQSKIKTDLFDPILNKLLGTEDLKIAELTDLRKTIHDAHELEAQKAVTLAIQENNQQVAHDIRGPIQSIGTLLAMANIADLEVKSSLERAVARASAVASGLLAKEVTREKDEVEFILDLGNILSEIANEKRLLFVGGTIGLMLPEYSRVKTLLSGETLSRILSNIIDNSILASDHDRRIMLSLRVENGTAAITVKDCGCGIAPDKMNLIGQKGYSARLNSEGTGRGIYSAKNALSAVGGSLEITSMPLLGTTVTVCFPAESLCLRADFVLIDDDMIHRKSWGIWARQNGYVLASYSSDIELQREIGFYALGIPIFIDVDLGGKVSGQEVARSLHAQGYECLILATAHENIRQADDLTLKGIIGKDPTAALPYLKVHKFQLEADKIDFA